MSVQIIVDSTVDMPERIKDRFRIVPLTVHFGDEEFVDGVTIDKQRFYERLVESDQLPTTSQATPAAFDKALIAARQPAVRSFARRSKGYTLKHIAHALAVAGRHQEAAYYMREALLVSFTFKWLAYTALGTVRAAFGRGMH